MFYIRCEFQLLPDLLTYHGWVSILPQIRVNMLPILYLVFGGVSMKQLVESRYVEGDSDYLVLSNHNSLFCFLVHWQCGDEPSNHYCYLLAQLNK